MWDAGSKEVGWATLTAVRTVSAELAANRQQGSSRATILAHLGWISDGFPPLIIKRY